MTLAGYQIDTVDAGTVWLDGGAMFGIVPRALWARRIAPDDQNRIPLATRCLLLRGHGRTVLVDTGCGDKGDDKFNAIYGIDPDAPSLTDGLRALGVAPEDVTDVVLTHLHFDHVGGATQRAGEGLALTFPYATHHVQASHWAWAQESPREGASFLPENLEPLDASGRLRLAEGDDLGLPNVHAHVVDGHTRGQQLVRVTDGERSVLFAGDLVPTAAHVPDLWIMAYDVAPLDTLKEKRDVLGRAAREGWLLVFEHDMETACARAVATEKGFRADGPREALPDEV